MSNRLVNAYSDDDSGSSGKPSCHAHQSSWIPNLNKLPCEQGSLLVPHSQIFSKEHGLHLKQKRRCASLNLTSYNPTYLRTQNFRNESSDNGRFDTSASRIHMDPSCSYEANSQIARKRNRSSMLLLSTNETTDSEMKSSEDDAEDFSKAMVISTRLTMPDEYNKYSAILVHERNKLSAILSRNQGDAPLFPQIEIHSFLITKRDQIVHKSTHNGGVNIQPLWTSTDSERDNHGDRSCELSAETHTRDAVALSNKNDFSCAFSPPLVTVSKRTMKDETPHTMCLDPMKDRVRGKLPMTEMPDTSSMDGMQPSTSITQSLDVEHLLPFTEQPKEEPSSRWVKRLKLSSESSPTNKEVLASSESMMGPTMNVESCSRKSKDTIFQCSWIQRWCQDQTVANHRGLNKGVVICEPDSSKLAFDEVEKKQFFPSVAAMAMMGKSMNGYRPCKLTKRGPLVIWNTDDN